MVNETGSRGSSHNAPANAASRSHSPFKRLQLRQGELKAENARLKEAIASRDAFLAMAAHELRNPMTPIMGRVGMLRGMLQRPDFNVATLDRNLQQIEWLVSRYMQRATTLLEVSRFNTGKFRLESAPVDVCHLIRQVVDNLQPIAGHAGTTIDSNLPAGELIINSDRLALEQVVDNLVSNAIKYGRGQPIRISASSNPAQQRVVICVLDHGPGIDAADQARIFERFERVVTPNKGASGFGVGLWLVQQLTTAMGGAVAVHSEPGQGSTFHITLPLPAAEPGP